MPKTETILSPPREDTEGTIMGKTVSLEKLQNESQKTQEVKLTSEELRQKIEENVANINEQLSGLSILSSDAEELGVGIQGEVTNLIDNVESQLAEVVEINFEESRTLTSRIGDISELIEDLDETDKRDFIGGGVEIQDTFELTPEEKKQIPESLSAEESEQLKRLSGKSKDKYLRELALVRREKRRADLPKLLKLNEKTGKFYFDGVEDYIYKNAQEVSFQESGVVISDLLDFAVHDVYDNPDKYVDTNSEQFNSLKREKLDFLKGKKIEEYNKFIAKFEKKIDDKNISIIEATEAEEAIDYFQKKIETISSGELDHDFEEHARMLALNELVINPQIMTPVIELQKMTTDLDGKRKILETAGIDVDNFVIPDLSKE